MNINPLVTITFFTIIINQISALHVDISDNEPHCFYEEFFTSSVPVVKYKIWFVPHNKEDASQVEQAIAKRDEVLRNILITITNEDGEIIHSSSPEKEKFKFPLVIKEGGYYKICMHHLGSNRRRTHNIFFQLKVMSDNMDEPPIDEAVKVKEVQELHNRIKKMIKRGEIIVSYQEDELSLEDNSVKSQIRNINFYYTLTVLQIFLLIGLAVYQFYSFRKFIMRI